MKNTMKLSKAEFEMLAEITSGGAEPSTWLSEIAGDVAEAHKTAASLKRRGFLQIHSQDGQALLIVTALGLRAFGFANGADPDTIEEAIKELELK